MKEKLAVFDCKNQIVSSILENQISIVTGDPGCGKTTQIPQFLLEAGLADSGMIVCTQPRRIAAVSAACRVAEERSVEVGKEVGYQVRLDHKLSAQTKLKYVTCGILLQEALNDSLLQKYSCILVDEAHERDIFTDVLIGYLKKVTEQRENFRLVIMSATLDQQMFQEYFPEATCFSIPTVKHNVRVIYKPLEHSDAVDTILNIINDIHKVNLEAKEHKDVLVFTSGKKQILEIVKAVTDLKLPSLLCLPLYSQLSLPEQQKVFEAYDGLKVIVATNIAESSVTIDGLGYVIDTGTVNVKGFDPNLGVGTLALEKTSQSEAIQRSGRAGRTQSGVCYRLYTEADFRNLPKYKSPAILRSNLTGLLLFLKALELDVDFSFITTPSVSFLEHADSELKSLGAIDEDGVLTDHGRDILSLPLEPKLAQFILSSQYFNCTQEAVIISAMLTVGRFFVEDQYNFASVESSRYKFSDPDSDFITLLNIWDDYEKSDWSDDWCSKNYLNPYWMKCVRTVADNLFVALSRPGLILTSSRNPEVLGKAILTAFRSFLLEKSGKSFKTIDGKIKDIRLSGDSSLLYHDLEYLVPFSIEKNNILYARFNQKVPKEWIDDHSPDVSVPIEVEVVSKKEGAKVDSLLDLLLQKSISEIGLSNSTLMKLWGINVETVKDLTDKTEKQLLKELEEFLGKAVVSGMARAGSNMIREIEEKLGHYNLKLQKPKDLSLGFAVNRYVFSLPSDAVIDENHLSKVLGEQYPLFKQYALASGDEKIKPRNEIVAKNMGLVTQWARLKYGDLLRTRDPSMDYDDLFQAGSMGLVRAAEMFDMTKGFRFSGFATWWIKQSITRAMDNKGDLPVHKVREYKTFCKEISELTQKLNRDPTQEEVALEMGKTIKEVEDVMNLGRFWFHYDSLDEGFNLGETRPGSGMREGSGDISMSGNIADKSASALDNLVEEEMSDVIASILRDASLSEVDHKIVELYFGINCKKEYTLEEIGLYIGVTRERIRQRLERTLNGLRTEEVWNKAKIYLHWVPKPGTYNPVQIAVGESSEIKTIKQIVADLPSEAIEYIGGNVPLKKLERDCFRLFYGFECPKLSISEIEEQLGIPHRTIINTLDRIIRKSRWIEGARGEFAKSDSHKHWSAMAIINDVAKLYSVSSSQLLGFDRDLTISRARDVAVYRMRDELKLTFLKISELLSRDYKNVISCYSRIKLEIYKGIIPRGCFPSEPGSDVVPAVAPVQPDINKRQLLSFDELVSQDISILNLPIKLFGTLRNKRNVNSIKDLLALGRNRLLMTKNVLEENVVEIENALRKEGIYFPSDSNMQVEFYDLVTSEDSEDLMEVQDVI